LSPFPTRMSVGASSAMYDGLHRLHLLQLAAGAGAMVRSAVATSHAGVCDGQARGDQHAQRSSTPARAHHGTAVARVGSTQRRRLRPVPPPRPRVLRRSPVRYFWLHGSYPARRPALELEEGDTDYLSSTAGLTVGGRAVLDRVVPQRRLDDLLVPVGADVFTARM